MVEDACDINFEDEGTYDPKAMFDGLIKIVETLKNIYTEQVLDEEILAFMLNFEIFKESEYCAFCKLEIKENEDEIFVIAHTTEKESISKLEELAYDDLKVETKPYKHPYDEDVTERYKITIRYWQLADSLKDMAWTNLKDAIENTQDSLEY